MKHAQTITIVWKKTAASNNRPNLHFPKSLIEKKSPWDLIFIMYIYIYMYVYIYIILIMCCTYSMIWELYEIIKMSDTFNIQPASNDLLE